MVKDFDELDVYKLALGLSEWIYDITSEFPKEEKYNIISQLRRAVTSIGANLTEGYGRFHYKENIQFCRNARGSLSETKHFMIFSKRRGYITQDILNEFLKKYRELQVKINNYIKSIGTQRMTMYDNCMTIV